MIHLLDITKHSPKDGKHLLAQALEKQNSGLVGHMCWHGEVTLDEAALQNMAAALDTGSVTCARASRLVAAATGEHAAEPAPILLTVWSPCSRWLSSSCMKCSRTVVCTSAARKRASCDCATHLQPC